MFQIHFSFVPFQRDCHLLKQEKDSFFKKKKREKDLDPSEDCGWVYLVTHS